jgi:organic radical activating enzyme
MEALLEKEGDVESWNDERLDELSRRMDAGFEKTATKEEMNLRFDEVDRRFAEVIKNFGKLEQQFVRLNNRIDRFGYAMIFFAFSLSAAVIANMTFS